MRYFFPPSKTNRMFWAYDENDDKVFFDRYHDENRKDIAGSASLALHKAIIGICGLKSIEDAMKSENSILYQLSAIQSYYVIYHIFTCCMLLDPSYKITFSRKYEEPWTCYEVDINELLREKQKPDDWNRRKVLEMDLATRITHEQIKYYCGKDNRYGLRQKVEKNGIDSIEPFIKVLYDAFIKDECNLIWYEEAAYIRDRCVYRPSFLPQIEAGKYIQTSLHVRDQIENMPSSTQLYDVVDNFLEALYQGRKEDRIHDFFHCFLTTLVDCQTDYLMGLDYKWEDLDEYNAIEEFEAVPSFIMQMIELYPPSKTNEFYNMYWRKWIEKARGIDKIGYDSSSEKYKN